MTVTLPLTHEPGKTIPPPEATPAPPRRVLVIDDNPDAADTLREALSLGGHDVHVAYDGPSGLEIAREIGPEAIICDIGLPEMDGYAVARALRTDPLTRGAYLIALSGYASPEDRRRAAAAGFDQHVAKPPSLTTLDRLLAEVPQPSA